MSFILNQIHLSASQLNLSLKYKSLIPAFHFQSFDRLFSVPYNKALYRGGSGMSARFHLFTMFACIGLAWAVAGWGAALPVLERVGPAEATVGVISLPLPRGDAELSPDAFAVGAQPVGWWERNRVPRRSIFSIIDDRGLPETVALVRGRKPGAPSDAWSAGIETTVERLPFKNVEKWDIDAMRGYPAADCTLVEGRLRLTYAGKTVGLQIGATGPDSGSAGPGGLYYWQNVQIDRLWANETAQALRAGGPIYNSDTYLWADIYLVLYRNGVAQVAAHFVNTKLAARGLDFQGLPVVRLSGDLGALDGGEKRLPADGMRYRFGALDLNLQDAAELCSEAFPGRLAARDDGLCWFPFTRTISRRKDAPPTEWLVGESRTVNFSFSLSAAAPVIARYRAPGWWYARCGELWPGDYLPVEGRMSVVSRNYMDHEMAGMTHGQFNAGKVGMNEGDTGRSLLIDSYLNGNPAAYHDGLAACIYWADLMIDHTDFTCHQEIAWPWKSCAYTKFRDVLYAYLETGDPYFLDTAELTAEAYHAWFRINWPRNSIGRDDFGLTGWALLWRFLDSEHAAERTRELVRMNRMVLEDRGNVGGQLGAGPHPGYHPSLYMTGVAMIGLLDAADAMLERGDAPGAREVASMLQAITPHFMRDDVESFPSAYAVPRAQWSGDHRAAWCLHAGRVYTGLARLAGDDALVRAGLAKARAEEPSPPEEFIRQGGKPEPYFTNPRWIDALALGARWVRGGVELDPIDDPARWPARQTVETPRGPLEITCATSEKGVRLAFRCPLRFPVTVRVGKTVRRTSSQDGCELP